MAALSDETLAAIVRLSVGTPVTDASDFTALTPAEVAAKFELASYGGDEDSVLYALGSDGDYDALDPDLPPVNDLGLWACGAFTNYAHNGLLAGAVVGTPGTTPTGWGAATAVEELLTIKGLPGIRLSKITTAEYKGFWGGYNYQFASAVEGDVFTASIIALGQTAGSNFWNHLALSPLPSWGNQATSLLGLGQVTKITTSGMPAGTTSIWIGVGGYIDEADTEIEVTSAGTQIVKLPYNPPVLALSSAATTTTKLAAITQREVAVWKPFVVVIEAKTGDTVAGTDPALYDISRSSGAAIRIFRSGSNGYIQLGMNDLGVWRTTNIKYIADNTAFKIAVQVCSQFVAISVDGGATQHFTRARSGGVFTLESIGCAYNGSVQWNGSIQSCTLIHPAVWTAAQLEAA